MSGRDDVFARLFRLLTRAPWWATSRGRYDRGVARRYAKEMAAVRAYVRRHPEIAQGAPHRTVDLRPCRGINANICAAEGCFGEGCRP